MKPQTFIYIFLGLILIAGAYLGYKLIGAADEIKGSDVTSYWKIKN